MKQFNLDEYLKNPNRKIITKDGKKVRILCANREGWEKKIIALVNIKGKEEVYIYFPNGRYLDSRETTLDLFFLTKDEGKTDTSMATAETAWGRTRIKQFSLEEYLNNPQRKVITRDGRNVRIVCTNRRGLNVKPIAALITIPNGDEIIITYWENGVATRGYEDNPNDLFFASEKKEGWVNLFKINSTITTGEVYNTEEEAKSAVKNTAVINSSIYISTVKIEWEE